MSHLSLIGLVLTACMAVCASRICVPDQWQANEVLFGHGYDNREHNMVYYDARNQMRAKYIYNYDYNQPRLMYHMIVRYDNNNNNKNNNREGRVYFYDVKSGQCKIYRLRQPWSSICIPEEARALMQSSQGPRRFGLPVVPYLMEDDRYFSYMGATIDGNSFYPTHYNRYGRDHQWSSMSESRDYYNFNSYISDNSVFDIPQACQAMDVHGDWDFHTYNNWNNFFGF